MTSVLVVTALPDDRTSTDVLRELVDHFEERADVDVETWFLRSYPQHRPWPGSRVVDDLRTSGPSGWARRFHVPVLPSILAGRELRRWLRRLDPDVVLLDDGLGSRVLDGWSGAPAIVVRLNEGAPADADLEAGPPATAALTLRHARATAPSPSGPVRVISPDLHEQREAIDDGERALSEHRRGRHGVPDDVPLLTGWGEDGWLDGPDVFIRCLWALEHRYGVVAHGLWVGVGSADDRARLEAEARRCGVADRYHLVVGDAADRFCGDAVFLPWRTAGDAEEILSALVAGLSVTAFPSVAVPDEAVTVVGHLDIDAAARSLSVSLFEDRGDRAAAARDRLDVGALADRLLRLRPVGV